MPFFYLRPCLVKLSVPLQKSPPENRGAISNEPLPYFTIFTFLTSTPLSVTTLTR